MHRIEYSRQKSKKNDATIASINTNLARIFPIMDFPNFFAVSCREFGTAFAEVNGKNYCQKIG